jgi:ParB family chromosome partitioning protein
MGRGLAAILPAPGEAADGDLRHVPVALIRPNPDQPRRRLDPESIVGLADSIAAAGVIQPLIVRALRDGRYELIAGERRWRAAQRAGLETVPVLVRDDDEGRRLETALIENVAREDLNPVDEARACATLVDDLGISKEELARRLGRSRPAVSNLIRLLDLPPDALELIASGVLSEGHGRAILLADGVGVRRRLARDAAGGGWSVRETERRAKGGGSRRRAKVLPHPDQEALLSEAEDALESALGHGVRIRAARRGINAELHFADLAELEAFAARLRAARAAE